MGHPDGHRHVLGGDIVRLLDSRRAKSVSWKVGRQCAQWLSSAAVHILGRGHLKCDGTRAETRFRLSAKRTSPFKSAGASVQSTTGSRGVRISSSNSGYTMFRGGLKRTGYPLHSPVPPLPASPRAITFQLDSTLRAPLSGRSEL